ncbi:DUF4192 domain-containing protein [Propionibacterium australiense]|nr:DUF4192 domain-containing protein [Propionibacterium australiense]VEH90965.1 Uncharacterised protein [Propionibacterium australiense]
MTTIPQRFTIGSRADLLALIPFLIGYRPDEALLVMACCDGIIAQSSCMSRALCQEPGALAPIIESMRAANPGAEFIVVGYGPPEWADAVVMTAREQLRPAEQLCCLVVAGELFWDVGEGDVPGLCPGRAFDPDTSPVAAQAVASGLSAHASRDEIVAMVAGPGELKAAETAAWGRAGECLGWTPGRQRAFVEQCLVDAAEKGRRLDRERLRRLCVLVSGPVCHQVMVRTSMGEGDPAAYEQLWADAVAIAPDRWAPAVLGLLGIASWRRGGGALLSEVIARLEAIDPASGMLLILGELRARRPPLVRPAA